MESNSWRPAQTEPPSMEVPSATWRSQLLPEARQRIVNKIMDTLRRHLPVAVPEGMNELQKIALRFEEKIYTVAVNQSDYLRKISLKMLSMESKTPQTAPMNPQSGVIQNSADAGSVGVPPQVNNQVPTMGTISVVNQPAVRQTHLPQNLQNNAAASMQVSSSLSASPSIPGRSQSNLPHYGQTSNMQSMPGMSHNAVNNSLSQGSASDIYANAARQMQPRPQPQSILSQQQQQQPQGSILYPNQLQSQLSKQKIHNNALLQQPIQQQQQQQQSLLQTNQLQPSQQTMMQMSSSLPSGQSSIQQSQPASVQSAPQSTLQQNHLNSIQQSVPSLHPQHVQAIARQTQQAQPLMHQQTSSLQQQAASIHQQSNLQTQQHQQLMGQQANLSNISSISNISNVSNISNIQHNQLLGQQNNIADIKPQQQQRLPVQQNNLVNMQQSPPLLNQQTLSLHPQQLGQQTNMQGLPQQLQSQNQQQQQQQPLLASLPNVSNMQTHQRSMQLLQQSKNMPQSQQQLQPSMSLLQSQGQQSHHQSSQQQLMSQIHSQSGQLQQQPNSMQREVQQRLQAPGALLQPQSAIEQQKQFMQSQGGVPEVSSVTSMDSTAQTGHISGDWQEELYQKIQSLKEEHLAEIQGFHQKITLRIQQHDTMPHSKQSANYERLKNFKIFLEQIMAILQIPKNNIPISLKEKLPMYESHINSLLSSRKSKVMPLQQPGQLQLQHQLQSSQVSQVQQHDGMGNQVQQINMPGSVTSMHSATASSMQHGSMTISGLAASMTQQSLMNSVQSSSSFDAVQTSSFSSLQHSSMGTVQQSVMGPSQNSLGPTQQTNLNGLSQSSIGALQPNASSIQNSSVLQQQHLKQQQEHVIQNQQLKQQLQQRQMQQQVFHQQQRQQQLQQPQQSLQQQQKQQPASQLPVHQISQLHPMNELNELKARPVTGIKAALYQQPYPVAQRQNYYHQQLKPSPSFPISSPQNLQASSPQISHNSSPQIDQHNLLPMLTKNGTPMQSAGSPFVVQSPSTPAPSPIPGDSEKLVSSLISLPPMGQSIHQQCSAPTQAQSIAVATPGMSASPLLAEFTTIEVNQPVMSSSKTSASDRPLERLIKAVRSFSSKALSSAVSDIGSVVSMIDRIAGSAPGNGSRAAVGEDLVAMTKCRLQARNFMSQDGGASTKKIKRQTSAMPLNNVSACSVNDNFVLFHSLDSSDLESTATSRVKRSKVEAKHSLQEEIREINQHLIDTVVSICVEDSDSVAAAAASGEGIIVKCSFSAVAFSPSLKAHFALMHTDPIAPLKLLVPANYPKGSPQLLDKPSVEHCKEFEDLSVKAKSTFSISLRSLSQPISLGEMVRTWDACARKVIVEYAQQSGGGSFSSSYGTWHNCVGA